MVNKKIVTLTNNNIDDENAMVEMCVVMGDL